MRIWIILITILFSHIIYSQQNNNDYSQKAPPSGAVLRTAKDHRHVVKNAIDVLRGVNQNTLIVTINKNESLSVLFPKSSRGQGREVTDREKRQAQKEISKSLETTKEHLGNSDSDLSTYVVHVLSKKNKYKGSVGFFKRTPDGSLTPDHTLGREFLNSVGSQY
jgi:hypothetical protein